MKQRSLILMGFLFSFGAAALMSGSVLADKLDQERAREALLKGQVAPLPKALEIVNQKFKGEAVEVELEEEHGTFIYEIKVLQKNGKVMEIELDAKTLKVLKVED